MWLCQDLQKREIGCLTFCLEAGCSKGGEDWTDKERKQIGTKATKQERWWASAWVKHSTELGQRFFSHSLHHTLHPCTAAALVIFIGTEMSHKPFHINNRVTTTRGLCMQMLGGVYSGDWRCGAALIGFALLTCWALTTPLLPHQLLLSQADWETKRLLLNPFNWTAALLLWGITGCKTDEFVFGKPGYDRSSQMFTSQS